MPVGCLVQKPTVSQPPKEQRRELHLGTSVPIGTPYLPCCGTNRRDSSLRRSVGGAGCCYRLSVVFRFAPPGRITANICFPRLSFLLALCFVRFRAIGLQVASAANKEVIPLSKGYQGTFAACCCTDTTLCCVAPMLQLMQRACINYVAGGCVPHQRCSEITGSSSFAGLAPSS